MLKVGLIMTVPSSEKARRRMLAQQERVSRGWRLQPLDKSWFRIGKYDLARRRSLWAKFTWVGDYIWVEVRGGREGDDFYWATNNAAVVDMIERQLFHIQVLDYHDPEWYQCETRRALCAKNFDDWILSSVYQKGETDDH